MMKKEILMACILGSIPLGIFAQYTGKVFVDNNKNGVLDRGEQVLKKVSVSDGLNVTQTDADGSYILPGHNKEKFLFITTPSGYKTNNAYYKRIEKGISQYNFGLQPYAGGVKSDGAHQFLHISDTEISTSQDQQDWVANLRDYAANEGAAFIIHTGDICYEAGLNSHIKLMNTANMNTQAFYCIGNHDLVKGKYGEELFEKLYGPTFYSFEVGNVHYIVTPMLGGDYRPSYTKEDVYRWLKNDLKYVSKEKEIMIFNHDLLTYDDSFKYGINNKEFIDLDAHNLKAWLYGHWHINHIRKHKSAYSICTSTLVRGGIDHASSGFRVMKVDKKGDFTSDFRYSYIDKSISIASIENMQAATLPSGNVPLSVNAYSTTTPTQNLYYSCSVNGKCVLSKRSMKQLTDFNWFAEMPISKSLCGQLVTVSVEACFKNGEIAKTESSFVYTNRSSKEIVNGSDWTNLLGNTQHIGLAKDALSAPLSLAWVQNVGSNIYMTSPLFYNGMVYAASIDENATGKASVIAMDAKDGSIRWKFSVRASVKNSIAIADGFVFAQDVNGNLYAIDANKGTLAWEKKLKVNFLPALNDGLIAADGIVYAGSGKGLCALQATTGNQLWQNNSWSQGEGTTATFSLNNNVLIGSTHWGALYGNDATTGKMLWSENKDGIRFRSSSAAMHNDLFYLLSKSSLFVMESKTGKILIRKELGYNVDVTSTPLVTDNEIIFGTADKGLVALHRETLETKWEYKTNPSIIYSSPYVRNPSCTIETSPVLSGNTVYVGASDGTIYALDKEKGTLQWKHSTGAPIFGSIAVSGNALYAVDYSGNVYGFTSSK